MSATDQTQESIFEAINSEGFTAYTLQLIDNYTSDILNGRTNLTQFNLQEHAGLCCADSVLIGAYAIACYARASLEAGSDASACQGGCPNSVANWEIDEAQEKLVQQWAEAKHLWFPNSESIISSTFGPKNSPHLLESNGGRLAPDVKWSKQQKTTRSLPLKDTAVSRGRWLWWALRTYFSY